MVVAPTSFQGISYLSNKIYLSLGLRHNKLRGMLGEHECSELRLHIKKVSLYFQFVVCLHIHPLAGDIMNSKLFLMHSVSLRFASCINQFLVHYIASSWVHL